VSHRAQLNVAATNHPHVMARVSHTSSTIETKTVNEGVCRWTMLTGAKLTRMKYAGQELASLDL
jgi:hypothetical protein